MSYICVVERANEWYEKVTDLLDNPPADKDHLIQALKLKLIDLEEIIQDGQREGDELNDENDRLEEKNEELEGENDQLTDKVGDLEDEITDLTALVEEYEKERYITSKAYLEGTPEASFMRWREEERKRIYQQSHAEAPTNDNT